MKRLPELAAQLTLMTGLAFTCLGLTTTPEAALSQPAPALPEAALEVTFVNQHRENVEAMVWADGFLMKLGMVNSGERRTFALPLTVTGGGRFYLLGDCDDGERITSDPLTATTGRQTHFVIGRTARDSYVRYTRAAPGQQP